MTCFEKHIYFNCCTWKLIWVNWTETETKTCYWNGMVTFVTVTVQQLKIKKKKIAFKSRVEK